MMIQKKNPNVIQIEILITKKMIQNYVLILGLNGKNTGIGGVNLLHKNQNKMLMIEEYVVVHYLDVEVQKQMVVDECCRFI